MDILNSNIKDKCDKEQCIKKKHKKRCTYSDCKKKLKLSDMQCRCMARFCSKHRLPETHECSWNPKGEEEMRNYIDKAGLAESIRFPKLQTI